jgi:phosphatidylglycerol:prolipoprotein diacylglycerol transferase
MQWQYLPYRISPYIFEIKGFGIRYYSLMYLVAFIIVYLLIQYRLKNENFCIKKTHIDDFIIWAGVGVMAGGRIGYVLFYDFPYYRVHPLKIFMPFEFSNGFSFTGISGMSYHGGLMGVVIATYVFCKKNHLNIWEFSDLVCPAIPLGYAFGRLGNFFNGELYGRVTDLPWGMYFPADPAHRLRHPSQLYEAFFEGIVLFSILWPLRKNNHLKNLMFSLYLTGYGIVRFFIEFVRMPDEQLSFVWHQFTMGQILCSGMIMVGICLFLMGKKSKFLDKKI